jgi:preprotein translocase subunit SecE
MNRQTKRMMQRQGTDKPRAPERRAPAQRTKKERVGPIQYVEEARGELRKVAWPNRREVVNSTIIVLICVIVMTTLVFLFDLGSARFVLFLFE